MSFKKLEEWDDTELLLVLAHYHNQVYFILIYYLVWELPVSSS